MADTTVAQPNETRPPGAVAQRKSPVPAEPGANWPMWLAAFVVLDLLVAALSWWDCLACSARPATACCAQDDLFCGYCGRLALAYALAPLIGAAVGATELVSRYRDKPSAALGSVPAMLYLAVNALASLFAFWVLFTGRLPLGAQLFGNHPALNALVVGGFGAMGVFRTALFNLKVSDNTSVAVGPAALLQVILRATDREVDRLRAGPRSIRVKEIMAGVSYELAKTALPFHCNALMQNLSAEEKAALDQAVAMLSAARDMSDETKAYNLGLLLMNLVGEDVLGQAVKANEQRLKAPPPDEPQIFGRASKLALSDLPALFNLTIALLGDGATGADNGKPATEPLEDFKARWLTMPTEVTNDADKVMIALARLRTRFGPETIAQAINYLVGGRRSTANQGEEVQTDEPLPGNALRPPGS